MSNPIPRVRKPDRSAGTVEQIDDLVYLVRDDHGEILDAGIEEFVEIERMNPKYVKVTLHGTSETKPVKLVIESDSPIRVRRFGDKVE